MDANGRGPEERFLKTLNHRAVGGKRAPGLPRRIITCLLTLIGKTGKNEEPVDGHTN